MGKFSVCRVTSKGRGLGTKGDSALAMGNSAVRFRATKRRFLRNSDSGYFKPPKLTANPRNVTLNPMHLGTQTLKTLTLTTLCGVLATSFLFVLLIYPLGVILGRSFADFSGVWDVLSNPFYLRRLRFTLFQALLSTLLTVLLALPCALLFARYDFAGKRILRSVFTIPFVMPSVVAGIGFLSLFGARGLTGLDLRNTFVIILLAHVFYNYAVVVRVVSSYLEGSGQRAREAARMLGASSARILFTVTLPLALPAVVAAATLVFIFCFTSFGVILFLAPAPEFRTLEVEIYQLSTRLLDLRGAGVLVLVQLIVITIFNLFYTRRQARLALGVARSAAALPKPQGWAKVLLGTNLVFAAALVLSPLAALAVAAFWRGGFTIANFTNLLDAPRTIGFAGAVPALLNSLRFASLSTLLALIIGFAFAYAVARGGWRWLDAASLLPLATSAVTLGFGYLLAFPYLRASPWGVTLAHTLIAFPFVTRALLPALRGIEPNLLDSSATLGAGALRQLFSVELPLLKSSLITAASFAFAISMGEFGATLTLQSARYATLPVAIFDRLGRPGAANYGAALALAFVLMLITGLVMGVLERFGEGEF